MRGAWQLAILTAAMGFAQQAAELRTTFEIRYVADGAVYVNGGRDDGLQEGFHLAVKRIDPGQPSMSAEPFASLLVTAVTAHSAVCSIEASSRDLQVGDTAQISQQDLEALQAIQQSKTARRYAQVVTFTDDDALDQEQRDFQPRPLSPEVNRFRGRVSYEFNTIRDHTSGMVTNQNGMVVRMDATRLGGTFWNFTGYWRGRLSTHGGGAAVQTITINDLLNRTYTIGLFYNNPASRTMLGFGRLYLPWATSLGTIDGGYYARRLGRKITAGTFAGSTPDPTAWDYKPNRQIAGAFANLQLGSFETVRFASTAGIALTRVSWKAEREFAFTETTFSWGQHVSLYHNMEADRLTAGRLGNTQSGAVLSRSFATLRVQPLKWLTVDLNHNYFRTVPTFDLLLVGTGVLDNFLFTGLSAGLRVDLPMRMTVYGNLGQSKRNDDPSGSLNQMYGIAVRDLIGTGVRVDLRHSVFNGNFGKGWYQSVSLSRDLGDRLRVEITGGQQDFRSSLSSDNRGFFMNSNVDWFLTRHYVLGGGVNLFRGKVQSYDQTFFSLGYRF